MNYNEIAQRLTNQKGRVTASVASTGTIYFRAYRNRDFKDLTVRIADHKRNPNRPVATSSIIEVATIAEAKKQIFNFITNS